MLAFAAATLAVSQSLALANQYVDCSSIDRMSSEKVIISLTGESSGTLFISWSVENDLNSGVLPLTRNLARDQASVAAFETKVQGNSLELFFPKSILGKESQLFRIRLKGSLPNIGFSYDTEFQCFSRLYGGARGAKGGTDPNLSHFDDLAR